MNKIEPEINNNVRELMWLQTRRQTTHKIFDNSYWIFCDRVRSVVWVRVLRSVCSRI